MFHDKIVNICIVRGPYSRFVQEKISAKVQRRRILNSLIRGSLTAINNKQIKISVPVRYKVRKKPREREGRSDAVKVMMTIDRKKKKKDILIA